MTADQDTQDEVPPLPDDDVALEESLSAEDSEITKPVTALRNSYRGRK